MFSKAKTEAILALPSNPNSRLDCHIVSGEEKMGKGLVYVGKIIETKPIEGADRIHLVTAICGSGGKWRGVTPREIGVGDSVAVFLHDALLPEKPEYEFMRSRKFRVSQARFKGVPSECLILPYSGENNIGKDITEELGIEKYSKPIDFGGPLLPAGDFPSFLRKTDEVLAQKVPWMLEWMQGKRVGITLKLDGASLTAFKHDGRFGVCSRNFDLKEADSPYWRTVKGMGIDKILGDRNKELAIQGELCGPGIQKNPLGLSEHRIFVFDIYDFETGAYLNPAFIPQNNFWEKLSVPRVALYECFDLTLDQLQELASQQKYPYGNAAEGIVVRTLDEPWCIDPDSGTHARASFKVLNLDYKE
jgi:RNA ligase (TIGR02306 family)